LILVRPRKQNREIPLTKITSWSSVELGTHAGTGISVWSRSSAIPARVNKARIEHLTLTARIPLQTRADVAVAVLGTGSSVGTGVYEAGVVLSLVELVELFL